MLGSGRKRDIAARPILLLPGFCSPCEVLRPLGRRLEGRLKRPVLPVSLGFGWGDIRDLAEGVHAGLERHAAALRADTLDVIGHSMGGLVAVYLLKCLDQGLRIRRVVTLGTPHRGLALAHAGCLLPGPAGRSMRQLRPGSPLLALLARLALPHGCELTSLAGTRDALVPPAATRLPDAPGHHNHDVAAADHLGLVLSKRSLDDLVELLGPKRARLGALAPLAAALALGVACSGHSGAPQTQAERNEIQRDDERCTRQARNWFGGVAIEDYRGCMRARGWSESGSK